MYTNGTIKINFSTKMTKKQLLEGFGEGAVQQGVVNLLNLEKKVAELLVFDHEFAYIDEDDNMWEK